MLKQLTIAATVMLVIISGCSKRGTKPHYAAELTCYHGQLGSGSNCSTIISDPNIEPNPNITITSQSISGGIDDKVSKISWKFIQHKNNKDVYSFERIFPVDTKEEAITSKVVEYEGRQVIVFQDEYQAIVLDISE